MPYSERRVRYASRLGGRIGSQLILLIWPLVYSSQVVSCACPGLRAKPRSSSFSYAEDEDYRDEQDEDEDEWGAGKKRRRRSAERAKSFGREPPFVEALLTANDIARCGRCPCPLRGNLCRFVILSRAVYTPTTEGTRGLCYAKLSIRTPGHHLALPLIDTPLTPCTTSFAHRTFAQPPADLRERSQSIPHAVGMGSRGGNGLQETKDEVGQARW